jgi:hypothetical protein
MLFAGIVAATLMGAGCALLAADTGVTRGANVARSIAGAGGTARGGFVTARRA